MTDTAVVVRPRQQQREEVPIWAPQPGPQTALLECPVGEIFYGGARGGGKSDGIIGKVMQQAGQYGAHCNAIVFRRTYKELEELEHRAHELLSPLGWSHSWSQHNFRAPNGARLKLRHLDRNADAKNYQGHGYTFIGVDEAGNFPSPEPIDLLRGTLRSAGGVPAQMVLAGNPGGPGQHWLRARYIDPAEPFAVHAYQPQPELAPDIRVQCVFIPAKLEDNAILTANDPGYEGRLAGAGGEALYRAWRFGDWDAFVGAAFDEWRREIHVRAFPVPADWAWADGLDWGYASHGWWGHAACGPAAETHWRKEFYFRKKPPFQVGYEYGELLKGWRLPFPDFVAADSAIFAVTGGGKTIAEELQRGINASLGALAPPIIAAPKGAGSRKNSKALLHQKLAWGTRLDPTWKPSEEHPLCPPWLMPKMTVHPDCKALVRTLPALPVDPNDSEDVDTDAEDHPYDGARYLEMSRTPEVDGEYQKPKAADEHPGFDKKGKRRERAPWEEDARRQMAGYLQDRGRELPAWLRR